MSAHVWVIEEMVDGEWVQQFYCLRTRHSAVCRKKYLEEVCLIPSRKLRVAKYERKDK